MNADKFKKVDILHEVVTLLEEEIDSLKKGFEEARLTSIESPGRMQSRYDTMGVEAAWVADGLSRNLQSKLEGLTRLRQLRLPDKPSKGCVGAILGIGPTEDSVDTLYFLLPAGGGITLTLNSELRAIKVVTPASPAGKALIGKEVGDDVTFGTGGADSKVVCLIL